MGREAEGLDAAADRQGHLLKLDETLVLVGAEFKVLPLFVHLGLNTVDHFLDLLRLLVDVHDATRAYGLCIAKLGGGMAEDIV